MIGFNMRAKSIVLAFVIGTSTSSSSCGDMKLFNPFAGVTSYISENKKVIALSTVVVLLLAMKVRLDTKRRVQYTYDYYEDFKALLNAYNIFDAESRTIIMDLFDKYFVGAKCKLEEHTTRTKEEDGTVTTLKSKKLTQKPSGLMGFFDAYVLQQLEVNNKLLPAAVTFYTFIKYPEVVVNNAVAKALKVESSQSDTK